MNAILDTFINLSKQALYKYNAARVCAHNTRSLSNACRQICDKHSQPIAHVITTDMQETIGHAEHASQLKL